MSTSSSDFNDRLNQSQDTYNRTATAISVGWIVGIVIILLSVIGFGVAGFYVYRRNQRRRRAREDLEQKHDESAQAVYGNPGIDSYTQQQQQSVPLTGPWAHHSEVHGSSVPPRYEIPNTEVLCKEVPNNEIPRNSYYDPPRSEVNGSDARRSELP